MKALIDGDVLVYECAFGAQTGWEGDSPPPFDRAAELLDNKINNIVGIVEADEYIIFLTGKNNFRIDIAKTLPYKGNRVQEKPFHYKNLRAYIQGKYNGIITEGFEADDAICLTQLKMLSQDKESIICTRDKDLRMVPGWHFGWELANQPQFGPRFIDEEEGYKNFFTQCLTGDRTDNIQGLPKCGPVKALKTLEGTTTYLSMFNAVREAYRAFYEDSELADERLLENGQLLWMVREVDKKGKPIMWRFPDEDVSS